MPSQVNDEVKVVVHVLTITQYEIKNTVYKYNKVKWNIFIVHMLLKWFYY